MFRTRKEDSLFDTTTDPNAIEESATVISAPPAAAQATAAAAPAAAAPAQAPAAAPATAYTAPQSTAPADSSSAVTGRPGAKAAAASTSWTPSTFGRRSPTVGGSPATARRSSRSPAFCGWLTSHSPS